MHPNKSNKRHRNKSNKPNKMHPNKSNKSKIRPKSAAQARRRKFGAPRGQETESINRSQQDLRATSRLTAAREDEDQEERQKSATKNDDAEVPEYLWQDHLVEDFEWRLKSGE
jgi:hypothetical protein